MSKILANEIANYGDNAPIDLKEGLNIPAGKPLQAAGSAGSSGQVLSSTGTSISWITPFDGSYNSLTNRPTIPAAQINSDWNASSGVAVILNKPSVPPLPSVTTASASGGGSLAYNSSNGQFTFTPADLSNASNWDTAYGWGDHGAAGYLTAETDTLATVTGRGASTTTGITLSTSNLILDSASDQRVQYNISGAETSKVIFRSTGALDFYSTNGMAFYASNAASPVNRRLTLLTAGGVQVEYQNSVRLETTSGGVTITGDIALGSGNLTTTGKLLYANHYDNLGDLPGASTYHGMFAHVHGTGKGYFAHAGAWTELLDVNSSMADLGDVDLTVAPTDGQVLKWEQSSGSWKAANDLTGGGGGGLALTDLSASNATASGGGSLSYNSGTGAFTFTPPDLSSYLTTETDPVFTASDAAAVTAAGIANWNTAYSWGNHAAQGYLVGYGGVSNHTDVNITGVQNGQILQYNGSDWVNITPSYISSYSETDTLQSVTDRGAITTNSIQTTGLLVDGASNAIDCAQGNITAGRTFQGFFTGTILAKEGKLTIVRRTSGNLVDISNTFGTTKTFVVDTNANLTLSGSLTAGGLTYPTTNGTSGQVLTSDGAGNVTWQNSSGGGGGASVTISDTAPAASAGDLWWESDTGRLKIYYQDTDSSQWVDTSPPLRFDNIDDIVTANGFKFRTNPSSPPAGTLGELRQINGKPYFYDGTTWQEFIFANAAVTTIPAETDWDKVLLRATFDSDFNDVRYSAVGTPNTYTTFAGNAVSPSTLVASPAKFGAKVLKNIGNGVIYPNRSEYDFTGEFTLECWVNFDSTLATYSTINTNKHIIFGKSDSTFTNGSWRFYIQTRSNGQIGFYLDIHDTATNTASTLWLDNITTLSSWEDQYLNTWSHIALVKASDGSIHLFRDGVAGFYTYNSQLFANNITNSTNALAIGTEQDASYVPAYNDMFIDDLRITKDARYTSNGSWSTQSFVPPTSAHPVSGSTTTFTPPPTSKAGEIALGASPTWTGTLGVTVTQQSSGNYRMSFTNPFANASDYYVIANHLDGSGPVDLVSVRSAGHVDFAVTQSGSNVDTGSISVQVIAH